MNRLRLTCPVCGKSGNAPAHCPGKRVRCPRCNHSFPAPAPASEDAAADLLLAAEDAPIQSDSEDLDEMYI